MAYVLDEWLTGLLEREPEIEEYRHFMDANGDFVFRLRRRREEQWREARIMAGELVGLPITNGFVLDLMELRIALL